MKHEEDISLQPTNSSGSTITEPEASRQKNANAPEVADSEAQNAGGNRVTKDKDGIRASKVIGGVFLMIWGVVFVVLIIVALSRP